MNAQHTPGPWRVEADGRSFIVFRLSHWNTGWREYLTARDGVSSRPSRFGSRETAEAAITKATGKKS